MNHPVEDGFRRRVVIGTRKFYVILTLDGAGRPRVHKTTPTEHRVGKHPGQRDISAAEAQVLKQVILEMLGRG